jgi:signal transduction histidine kinase
MNVGRAAGLGGLLETRSIDAALKADIAAIGRIEAVPQILEIICKTTGMGFAAVARVTDSRWICCAVRDDIKFGIEPGGELKVETTICNLIRQKLEGVAIDHVANDAVFSSHPIPAMYGFQSYISMPIIRRDGGVFGTLCAIDPRPARVNTPETIGTFTLFAQLIAFHLDALQHVEVTETTLASERKTSELREQFIAVLGHDLRNPLASIAAGTRLLGRAQPDDKKAEILTMMQQSVRRMAGLIDNVMDLARARLGGGLAISRTASAELEPVLEQVIAELRTSAPTVVIKTHFALAESILCDAPRIAQLLSNLLGNAITHGTPDKPIMVRATSSGGVFELSVSNSGEPIADIAMGQLFLPFSRGAIRPNQQGLGLGLYIASEIAKAHGGTLNVVSVPAETRFTFRMPLAKS